MPFKTIFSQHNYHIVGCKDELEGTVGYAGLLIAPAEGFSIRPRLFGFGICPRLFLDLWAKKELTTQFLHI